MFISLFSIGLASSDLNENVHNPLNILTKTSLFKDLKYLTSKYFLERYRKGIDPLLFLSL